MLKYVKYLFFIKSCFRFELVKRLTRTIMQKKVSIKDIAKHVGVSTALVSYVMTGSEKAKKINEDLIRKIKIAAEELNYQPNEIARSLRKGSTKSIGLIVADIANPFFAHLSRAVENEALKYGYSVIIGSSDELVHQSELLMNTFINRQVDGLIIAPAEGTEYQIHNILEKNIPLVLVDRFFPDINTNYVIVDNFKAVFDATNLLIHRGYKNIGFISYKSSLFHFEERKRGYCEAIHKNNLCQNILEVVPSRAPEEIDLLCSSLYGNKMDALLFSTNMLAIEGLYSIHKRKIRIPEDLGFIGYDGGNCFNLFYTPITYIEQPINVIAKEAVDILINTFNNTSQPEKLHIVLDTVLKIQKSC